MFITEELEGRKQYQKSITQLQTMVNAWHITLLRILLHVKPY